MQNQRISFNMRAPVVSGNIKKYEKILKTARSLNSLHQISEKKIESSVTEGLSICVASDGRLLYSTQQYIFLESNDNRGWLKVYEAAKERMVVSISQWDGDLYFIETETDKGQNHAVHCLPEILKSDGTITYKSPTVCTLLTFVYDPTQDVESEGDYIYPCLSVADGVCFVRYGQKVISYSLATGERHSGTLPSFGCTGASHAVVLSAQQLWTTASSYDLVAFYNPKFDRELCLKSKFNSGLCGYGEDHLIMSDTMGSDDEYGQLDVLNSSGKLSLFDT